MAKRRKTKLPDDMRELPISEAVDRMAFDPDNVFFPLREFADCFGLSDPKKLRAELASGRLRVLGRPLPNGGYSDLMVTYADAVQWLARRRMTH